MWQQLFTKKCHLPGLCGRGCESRQHPHMDHCIFLSLLCYQHKPNTSHASWDHKAPGVMWDAEVERDQGTFVFWKMQRGWVGKPVKMMNKFICLELLETTPRMRVDLGGKLFRSWNICIKEMETAVPVGLLLCDDRFNGCAPLQLHFLPCRTTIFHPHINNGRFLSKHSSPSTSWHKKQILGLLVCMASGQTHWRAHSFYDCPILLLSFMRLLGSQLALCQQNGATRQDFLLLKSFFAESALIKMCGNFISWKLSVLSSCWAQCIQALILNGRDMVAVDGQGWCCAM